MGSISEGFTGRTREWLRDPEALGFHQSGFTLSLRVSPDAKRAALEEHLEALLFEVLTPGALECGGGVAGAHFQGFVTRWKGSASEADRHAVSRWLRSRPGVVESRVGPLVPAWYGV